MLGKLLENVRQKAPLVHCMANFVTANDCANLLLAVGASPIMADDPMESQEITARCAALTLSLGTPGERRLEAMRLSALEAKRREIPVILDPVGVTISSVRLKAAKALLDLGAVSVIRGNASEIRVLAGERVGGCGLEAEDETACAIGAAKRLAAKAGAVVVMTGETDIVTDGVRLARVHNGHPIQRSITGAGCQLTALLGAFAAANPESLFDAALAGTCMMGLCAETAHARMSPVDGSAACRGYIIDAAYNMTGKSLEEGASYEN
ncbi:MAG: hydroxyethylthiazole kinase [Clostridia bacterium]|nr:hydroxyethylthiazole kinase [Clostridia bacterium]